jgi:hypothetical protein
MKSLKKLRLCSVLVALLALASAAHAATGEVSLSGSTWTGKVDGVTKYTGNDLTAAGNACVGAMSSGTLRIYNGGTATGSINLKSNVKVDGWGNTITGNFGGGVIRARNSSATGAINVNIAGSPWFGMYFQTCSGQNFSGVNGTGGILMRIDNCAGGGGSNFSGGSPRCTASGSHGVETYGINSVSLIDVTATDRGHCGVLLNNSTNSTIRTVSGTRCGTGTGYAAFRTANTNLGPTTVTTVNANDRCGRVFYSTTNSQNTTISTINASGNQNGIWFGSVSRNVRVNGGTVTGNGTGTACWYDSNPADYGNVCRVTCR